MEIAGLKVIDARKPLAITITKGDVARGKTKDPGSCAAARAAVRSGACTEARVHLGRTYLKVAEKGKRSHWVRYITPAAIRTEVVAFDRGVAFQPGNYVLRPISKSTRLGAGKGSNTNRNKPKHLQKARAKQHVVAGVRTHGANR